MITTPTIPEEPALEHPAIALLRHRQRELQRELDGPTWLRQRSLGVTRASRDAAIGAALADLQHNIDLLSAGGAR